ncbi:IPT/TIG domain-containing protein [Maribacter halichondriae]|uniref:IPT/TIG domain-containing protein n=1 Tax=Maribacter halichondriae TaxID=2980554 RepID=UPI002359B15F|nr:IPT/TIG domain-containing protein [Maribacter sp. Hal144]
MKTHKLIHSVVLITLLTLGCHKDDGPEIVVPIEENLPTPNPVPMLNSISPESGPKNTTVTIKGIDFGTDKAKVKVFFNDVKAMVESVTETEIKTKVPSLALTGPVKVMVDGKELTGPDFTYEFSEAHVSTLAGNKDASGNTDGQGTDALFSGFGGITRDVDGNLYVAQPVENTIRKITLDGLVTTFAGAFEGYEDGPLHSAKFKWISDVAIDASGNMYVADTSNNRIRKISPDGTVSTLAGSWQGFADGQGIEARFFLPDVITVDSSGNVFVAEGSADYAHTRIRKITPEGLVTTFAGWETGFLDGQGTDASFKFISGMTMDNSGNIIVADAGNNKIRKVSPDGHVSTIAGSTEGYSDGMGDEAQFYRPWGLAVDKLNNIYVADYSNMRIRKIDPKGMVSTVAGSGSYGFDDGEGQNATIAFPRTLIVDDNFNLFVTQNNVIRKIALE